LLKALNRQRISGKIAWKPFELNPAMSAEGQLLAAHLHEKYGTTKAQIDQITSEITARGAELGFSFKFKENVRIYNTFNAHRLLYWSRKYERQTELKLALFGLYFSEGGNPGSKNELIETVAKIGLPTSEARELLESNEFANEVRAEEANYQGMGINMVPTFMINNKYKIVGGETEERFMEILQAIIATEATGTHS
jgi:predicted DsbA family dithiol-disulfide isomerase